MSNRRRTRERGPRRWEGRALPRPTEDLEDQGLGFDVQTALHRRAVLRGVGLGALGVGAAACGADPGGSSSTSSGSSSGSSTGSSSGSAAATSGTGEIPDETAGPYPGDGSNGPDALEESGIVRSDIRSSFGGATGTAEGIPMTLELVVSDLADGGSAFAGVAVYVWHCDREGRYSMYSEGVEDENYLRGAQIADGDGIVRFTSIVPACYAGRWPHIHFEVYPDRAGITDPANAIATSQVALPKAICDQVYASAGYEESVANLGRITLQTDNVFGDDGGASQLASVTGSNDAGYTVTLAVRVDTSTTPTGGGLAPGGDGAPPGGPGGTPPEGAPST